MPGVDRIILVEILENSQTVQKKTHKGPFGESCSYRNDIKSLVLGLHLGTFEAAQYNTIYSMSPSRAYGS